MWPHGIVPASVKSNSSPDKSIGGPAVNLLLAIGQTNKMVVTFVFITLVTYLAVHHVLGLPYSITQVETNWVDLVFDYFV